MNIKTKSFVYGLVAVIIVLLLNLIVLALLDFPLMSLEIIKKYFVLIILLIGGFGLQVGLFTYFRHISAITCSTTAASGGIAGVSMILCCSHYLLNLLPFLGAFLSISALTALADYTFYFLLLGIFSNIIGIGIMFSQNKKYRRKNER